MGATYDPGVNKSDISTAITTTNEANQRQRDFINAMSGGIGNQNTVFQNAMGTMNQLQDQTQGGGPNPALAQLALTTGQNVKNQAALLAGQRGVGANPGLAARQIGQVGADAQQQAVGQGAVMRAQQQLAAQQQLQQQQALLAQIAGTQVGFQQQGIANLGGNSLNQSGQYLGAFGQAGKTAADNDPGKAILGGLIGAAGTIGGAAMGKPKAPVAYSFGGKISGQSKVKGDSPSNDTVPAMLSPGEVVIPRTHVKDPKKVAAFINSTLGMNLKVGKKA